MANKSTTIVIVFTKTLNVPVKTRIAEQEGALTAKKIYSELLEATKEQLIGLHYCVAYTGSKNPDQLKHIFNNADFFFEQSSDDLGERMKNSCLYCKAKGYDKFIVIGCDCPLRTNEELKLSETFLAEGTDVVLGPTEDGGYHLAGVNEKGLQIFSASKWSTEYILNETIEITKAYSLSVKLLERRFDIDTYDDYRRWKCIRKNAQ
jgi:rSAM/selenodomain-associated transferase 1